MRLQRQSEVVAELSILDKVVIDIGPAPAYQEGKDASKTAELPMREINSLAAAMSSGGRPVFRQNKLHLLAFVEHSCKNLSRVFAAVFDCWYQGIISESEYCKLVQKLQLLRKISLVVVHGNWKAS